MFDPSVSIYTAMVVSNLTMGINEAAYRCGALYITVDSEESILMNWDFEYRQCKQYPDTIKFYSFNKKGQIAWESVKTKGNLRGYHKTNQTFPVPMDHFPNGWDFYGRNEEYKTHCLPYIIESSLKGQLVDRRCLRIFPAWMQNFGELRIGEMLIPGTHNSGAWNTGFIVLPHYILNQDRNLYEQLVFGQRYFDIRLGINDDNQIFITHSIFTVSRFDQELDNIARFVEKSPKEIIILDIHKFTIPAIFTAKQHRQVFELLLRKIGKYIIPRTLAGEEMYGPKLKQFWQYNKSIIVAYADKEEVAYNKYLWPAIDRDWGNKISKKELEKYIVSVVRAKRKSTRMRVIMAELTPNPVFVVFKPKVGLGLLADEINRSLIDWIQDNHLTDNINMIASDFFLGNRMTEFAIGVNSKKEIMRKEKEKRFSLMKPIRIVGDRVKRMFS